MFERFTERARQVVVLAQDEARTLGHNYIGTEHLLLGLMREEQGVAAQCLAAFGLTLDGTRERVQQIVGVGESTQLGQIPFTPRAKKVLELALREALAIGHNYIGTEHILLGLAHEGDGVAMHVLLDRGVPAQAIRARLAETLGVDVGDLELGPRGRRAWRRRTGFGAVSVQPCWEYRVEKRDAIDTDWLNELGAESWELVSVAQVEDSLAVIFKRRRQFPGALRAAG